MGSTLIRSTVLWPLPVRQGIIRGPHIKELVWRMTFFIHRKWQITLIMHVTIVGARDALRVKSTLGRGTAYLSRGPNDPDVYIASMSGFSVAR